MNRGFIINILAIGVVLGIVFLSQGSVMRQTAADSESTTSRFLGNARNWFLAQVYPRVSGGVDLAQDKITEQKDIAAENIWDKIKNYLAEKFSKYSGTKVE